MEMKKIEMRILLAEDEKELSNALVAILKHNNYSVDPVYDGADALSFALSENYDLLILDIFNMASSFFCFCTLVLNLKQN